MTPGLPPRELRTASLDVLGRLIGESERRWFAVTQPLRDVSPCACVDRDREAFFQRARGGHLKKNSRRRRRVVPAALPLRATWRRSRRPRPGLEKPSTRPALLRCEFRGSGGRDD